MGKGTSRPVFTAPVEDEPMPPPRRRRRLLRALAFLALFPAIWLAWDRYAWYRANAEVARLHAAGEPVWETDFPTAAVPDADNAAVFLHRAGEALHFPAEEESHEMDDFYLPPLSAEAVASLGRVLEQNRAALADVRRATGAPAVAWGSHPLPQFDDVTAENPALRELNRQRALAQLLAYAVRHAHATGNDLAAVAFLRDSLTVGRGLRQEGSLIDYFIGEGCDAMAARELESLAADLRVGAGSQASSEAPASAAGRADVDELIAAMLDPEPHRRALVRGLQHERQSLLVTARPEFTRVFRHRWGRFDSRTFQFSLDVTPPVLDAATDRLARPFLLLRSARLLDYQTRLIEAARVIESGGAVAPRYPATAGGGSRLPDMFGVHWVLSLWQDQSSSGLFTSYARAKSDRARAASALATRLYQIDHGGRMPPTTASLIPAYLPSVPKGVSLPTVPVLTPPTKPSTSATASTPGKPLPAVPGPPATRPATTATTGPATTPG